MGFPRARDHARMRTRAWKAGFCAFFLSGRRNKRHQARKRLASQLSGLTPDQVDTLGTHPLAAFPH